MEHKYSDFKKINPFRVSSRGGNDSSRFNKRKTNFPERLDSETKPKLFSPPEIVDKEFKNERFDPNENDDVDSNNEEGVSSFIDEFSSMLDGPSQSYSGTMDDSETSLWQEEEEEEEHNVQQTEEERTSTRSDHDERRNKRNPFINEFTAMLEEYSESELGEEKGFEVTQEKENFTAHNPSQYKEGEQEYPFVNEFTAMLDDSAHQEEEEVNEDLEEKPIDDSDITDVREESLESRSESFDEEELAEEDSFHKDFTAIVEADSAHEQGEESSSEVINDEIKDENLFKEEFTSMLEDGSSGELEDDLYTSGDSEEVKLEPWNDVKQPKPQIEINVKEDEHSEDYDQNDEANGLEELFGVRGDEFYEELEEDDVNDFRNVDEEEMDYTDSLQQEMLSIFEETDDEEETSLQFMEDVIEYFDEIEENRTFPLDRFLEFLMNVYCSEESSHVIEIDEEESVEEEDEEINEHQAEDGHLEDSSVVVKLPVTLTNVNVEVDILKEIDLHTPISNIKNIKWSISSLKSKVLLPSSTVFFKGIVVVEVEFEGHEIKNSTQSIQFPVNWEKSVDVSWMTAPELYEEYEKEYTFDGNSRDMHLESYQKLAHEIEHELKDVRCIWHYDVDRVDQPNSLQLNGSVTLLIDLSQYQYLPI